MQRKYVLVQLHDKGKIQVPENSPTHLKAIKQIQGWHVVGEPYTPVGRSGPGGQPISQKKSPAAVAPVTNRPAAERAVGKGQSLKDAIPVPPFDSSKVLEPIRSPKKFPELENPVDAHKKANADALAVSMNIRESETAGLEAKTETTTNLENRGGINAAGEFVDKSGEPKTPIAPSKGKPGPKPKIK